VLALHGSLVTLLEMKIADEVKHCKHPASKGSWPFVRLSHHDGGTRNCKRAHSQHNGHHIVLCAMEHSRWPQLGGKKGVPGCSKQAWQDESGTSTMSHKGQECPLSPD